MGENTPEYAGHRRLMKFSKTTKGRAALDKGTRIFPIEKKRYLRCSIDYPFLVKGRIERSKTIAPNHQFMMEHE